MWHIATAADTPILAIVPDNRWAAGGPVSALVKGLSNVPSWNIPPDRAFIAGLQHPFDVRSEQSNCSPAEPYPGDATLVWEDLPGLPLVTSLYPAVAAAAAVRDCRIWEDSGAIHVCTPASQD